MKPGGVGGQVRTSTVCDYFGFFFLRGSGGTSARPGLKMNECLLVVTVHGGCLPGTRWDVWGRASSSVAGEEGEHPWAERLPSGWVQTPGSVSELSGVVHSGEERWARQGKSSSRGSAVTGRAAASNRHGPFGMCRSSTGAARLSRSAVCERGQIET